MLSKLTIIITIYISLKFITKVDSKIVPIVKSDSGTIVGTREKTILNSIPYNSFRGIPYAEPILTKEQRFLPTKLIKPWQDPVLATADKPRCLTYENKQVVGSEDCLYLNIYVPKKELSHGVNVPKRRASREWDDDAARNFGKALTLRRFGSKKSRISHNEEILKRPLSIEWHDRAPTNNNKGLILRRYGSLKNQERAKKRDIIDRRISNVKRPLKPVLVWIHGGAFVRGNGNSSFYGPDFLLEEDLVVVTVQYRLGALGFLNLNIPQASGNMGLKDQVLALRWIKRNIKYFEGDPNKITLVGQSAGGVSVDFHKISDMSTGLFQQTISMSASPFCTHWALGSNFQSINNGFAVAKKLGFTGKTKLSQGTDELVDFLLNVPASKIIEASEGLDLVNAFKPTLERIDSIPLKDKFLSECIQDKYQRGNYSKGPHLMGFTTNEFLEFAMFAENTVDWAENLGVSGVLPFTDTLSGLISGLSKYFFNAGIDTKNKYLANNNDAPVYYYKFDFLSEYSAHKGEGIVRFDGVAHEDELPYLFFRSHVYIPLLKDPAVVLTRKRLVKLWTNFVKTGNPTPDGKKDTILQGITWPDSGKSGIHLRITNNLEIIESRPIDATTVVFQRLQGQPDSFCNPLQGVMA